MARGRETALPNDGVDFSVYVPALTAYIARNSRNQSIVEDLVQEVMLRLHARQQGNAIENIEGYLFRIAASVLADNARRERTRYQSGHRELTELDHPVEDRSPERVLQAREEVSLVAAALQELPKRTRDAFLMKRFEDLPYAEIARRLDVSVSAVEKHVVKAMAHVALRLRG